MSTIPSLAQQAAALASGETTSRSLVEAALAAATHPAGEGKRVFTKIYAGSAQVAAEAIDQQRRHGISGGPLAGLPISVKDLFDVAGEPTPAGSVVLADAPPAVRDAPVIARLRAAGAVLVGRTNMTEFAFSGLGINPHYGTPRNPYDRAQPRIPGGSSSGAAVSVTDGMAAAAIGSDTGGSVRIPAALCGLTGFKPTARRVPLDGVLPLSGSLDSIGPIAPTVACCALLDAVLSGQPPQPLRSRNITGLRMGVLQGYVLDGLEQPVVQRFEAALEILARAGAHITDVNFAALKQIPECNAKGGLIAAEAYAWHRQLLEKHSDRYDPRVSSRMMRGRDMSAVDYLDAVAGRQRIIAEAEQAFADFDVWLVPTTPRIAPRIADLEASDAAYFDANAAILRNPSVFNFLDCCALSIPCHLPGEAPVGLMVAAPGGQDQNLLRIGAAIEAALAAAGCAIPGRATS
jgi:aspartyl-tRNA(Asn)/glutamyl-tRNA(Gln) amidotransferase subunit A